MQLSKLGYYSDFFIYPAGVVALAAIAVLDMTWAGAVEWAGAGIAGLVLWTLMEYVLHRHTLHRWRYFSPMHGLHHATPLAFIGTPTWMSVSILCVAIFLPSWWGFGFNVADGLMVGVMSGYWWYGVVHHLIHHRSELASSGYWNELRAWHLRHHYSPKSGNFGVTTAVWDHVFGTAIRARKATA
jgi:sterol desaturase/sphingolipid hydroxylase (fatty acid hydroxylase superfamily)